VRLPLVAHRIPSHGWKHSAPPNAVSDRFHCLIAREDTVPNSETVSMFFLFSPHKIACHISKMPTWQGN
jgi:hypothetical protein